MITLIEKHVGEGTVEATFQSELGVVHARRRTDRDGIAIAASYVEGPLSNWVLYRSIDAREMSIDNILDAVDAANLASDRALADEIGRRYTEQAWFYGGLRTDPPTLERFSQAAKSALKSALYLILCVTPAAP